MTTLAFQLALFLAALPPSIPAQHPDERWGTLKGKFVYDGPPPVLAALLVPARMLGNNANPVDESLLVDPQGGIQNVVVYVRDKNVNTHPRAMRDVPQQVALESKGCRFEPHILTVTTSQTMVICNRDQFAINAMVWEIGCNGLNVVLAPGKEVAYKYSRAQSSPQPITSNIQPWCKAYILPRANPYSAVSKPDGTFEIHGLPIGKIEFQVWHEKAGFLNTKDWPKGRFTIDIMPGDNDLGRIKLNANLFEN